MNYIKKQKNSNNLKILLLRIIIALIMILALLCLAVSQLVEINYALNLTSLGIVLLIATIPTYFIFKKITTPIKKSSLKITNNPSYIEINQLLEVKYRLKKKYKSHNLVIVLNFLTILLIILTILSYIVALPKTNDFGGGFNILIEGSLLIAIFPVILALIIATIWNHYRKSYAYVWLVSGYAVLLIIPVFVWIMGIPVLFVGAESTTIIVWVLIPSLYIINFILSIKTLKEQNKVIKKYKEEIKPIDEKLDSLYIENIPTKSSNKIKIIIEIIVALIILIATINVVVTNTMTFKEKPEEVVTKFINAYYENDIKTTYEILNLEDKYFTNYELYEKNFKEKNFILPLKQNSEIKLSYYQRDTIATVEIEPITQGTRKLENITLVIDNIKKEWVISERDDFTKYFYQSLIINTNKNSKLYLNDIKVKEVYLDTQNFNSENNKYIIDKIINGKYIVKNEYSNGIITEKEISTEKIDNHSHYFTTHLLSELNNSDSYKLETTIKNTFKTIFDNINQNVEYNTLINNLKISDYEGLLKEDLYMFQENNYKINDIEIEKFEVIDNKVKVYVKYFYEADRSYTKKAELTLKYQNKEFILDSINLIV